MSKHSAFASSMLSLTLACSWSPPGFPQGPSVRAQAVDFHTAGPDGTYQLIDDDDGNPPLLAFTPDGSLPAFGEWSVDEAFVTCSKICYGPLEDNLDFFKMLWRLTFHFDDDPEDTRILQELTGVAPMQPVLADFNDVFHATYYDDVDERWLRQTPKRDKD